MLENKKSNFRLASGVCYILAALYGLFAQFSSYTTGIVSILQIIALILVAVGMFLQFPLLSVIGSGIQILTRYRAILQIKGSFQIFSKYQAFWGFWGLVLLLYWVVFLLAVINIKGKRKNLGIASGCLLLILSILTFGRAQRIIFKGIIPAVGAVLFALAADDFPNKISSVPAVTPHKSSNTATSEYEGNRVERLAKLKELLDKGVISQEEFDAKKKQIMGL